MRRYLLGCILILCLFNVGCAQRIGAHIIAENMQAVATPQTYTLVTLPSLLGDASWAEIQPRLHQALQDMGYRPAADPATAQCLIRVYWDSAGPFVEYVPTIVRYSHWHHPFGHRWGRHSRFGWGHPFWDDGWGRVVLVPEDKFLRRLVIEAMERKTQEETNLATPEKKTAAKNKKARGTRKDAPAHEPRTTDTENTVTTTDVGGAPVAQRSALAAALNEPEPAPQQTAEMQFLPLPAETQKLLWRVVVVSKGNVSRAHRVLPELVTAAIPWLGKTAIARVVVQGENVEVLAE